VHVAPVGRLGFLCHALIEQLPDQGVLAAAGTPHDVQVVAGMAHADAEMRGIDGTHLADALRQVFKFGGGRKGELPGITGSIQLVRRKREDGTHVFNLVAMARNGSAVNLGRKFVEYRGNLHPIRIGLLELAQRFRQTGQVIRCKKPDGWQTRRSQTAPATHHQDQERLARLGIRFQRHDIARHAAVGIMRAEHLLAPGPGGLAFRTLAACTAGVFLQLVGAIEKRHVARRIDAGADAKTIYRRTRAQHVAQRAFVEVAAGKNDDMAQPPASRMRRTRRACSARSPESMRTP